MATSSSLTRRALLAVGLMIGFYTLALLGMVGALAVPVLEYVLLDRVHFFLLVPCLAAACGIAWSIWPRRDRFEPRGVRVEAAGQPRLFALLSEVAQAAGEPVPAEVWLTVEVNASVTEHRGRRVLVLGLLLAQQLTVAELKGVLAHELGHFRGGDVFLGRFVYSTRSALLRTVEQMREQRTLLQAPFERYARYFLRVSQQVARQQEYEADAFAASAVGSAAMIGALKGCIRADAAAAGYLEIAQDMLGEGMRPPLLEGFQRFMQAEALKEPLAQALDEALEDAEGHEYDSHPPMRDRIKALEGLGLAAPEGEAGSTMKAIELFDDVDELELGILSAVVGLNKASALRVVGWSALWEVRRTRWVELRETFAEALRGWTVRELPGLVERAAPLGRELLGLDLNASSTQCAAFVRHLLASAWALRLEELGWALRVELGEPVVASSGDRRVEPQEIIRRLVQGELTREGFEAELGALGLLDLRLAALEGGEGVPSALGPDRGAGDVSI